MLKSRTFDAIGPIIVTKATEAQAARLKAAEAALQASGGGKRNQRIFTTESRYKLTSKSHA